MDRQQAVTILERKTTIPGDGYTWEQINKAIDMAISALSPPNEPPPCYQPDGDGCAYQCYDGDDEPIDKCKECPLCYSDKQRHHTPPNEPLTCKGCYYDKIKAYVHCSSCSRDKKDLYRRPPEGEEREA